MPRLCAFGCQPTGVAMHCFPSHEKFPERFKARVTLCGGKLETEFDYEHYKKKIVCDLHFTDKDRNRNKRLYALAVPSLCLSGVMDKENLAPNSAGSFSQTSNSVLATTGIPDKEIVPGAAGSFSQTSNSVLATTGFPLAELDVEKALKPVMPNIVNHSTLKSADIGKYSDTENTSAHVLGEHNYSAASRERPVAAIKRHKNMPGYNCAQVNNMRTQIKRLRSEVCRLRKNGKFQSRLANAAKLSENVAFQHVVQRISKPSQLFINMQMQASKKPKGRRFSIEEKVLSLSLYKKSPKCYALLHKYFTLPSAKAMKRLLSKITLRPGINPIIFEKIKKTVAEKDTTDKICSLVFDEMSITAQINYNDHRDTIEGFASNNESQFADHALVFMVKGVKQNFKQPIAYYFTNCLKKGELKKLIKTVIHHAQDSGLIILNTVCDQSTVNVSAINELVEDTKAAHLRRGVEWRYDCFSVNGRKIIPLFDTPHLIKGIRNNLLTKDLHYTTNNIEKTVKWEYFQKIYAADKAYGELKLLHKITEEHINPEKI